ncbi:hypothetical protein [Stygiolobus caldivivus]|uniref:Uncharacterized protein n=1 Tax=Stygiolobus caldivivus TaxID=2824673 RepID=A0A8D5ZF75_9CREN|nr:hypothetical protein [Stygiolobus caldivivus]BCU70093.1 hypothetical protein KN1_13900 [Stygiolobus caldivivus]
MGWNTIVKKGRVIVLVWAIVLSLMIVPALNYNKFITYSQQNPASKTAKVA